MNISSLVATLALTAAVATLGCGGDKSTAPTGAATAGSATPGVTTAAAGGKAGVVATCAKKGICTEYRNTIPDLSQELCTGTDGTFTKGAGACPTDQLLGTCVNKVTPDATTYWYGTADEADISKGVCEGLDGKWTAGGAKAAATASAAAAATAGAGAAPPRTAPARTAPARKKR